MSTSTLAEHLIAKLEALPPSVNKYLAAAQAIKGITATATSAPWLQKLTLALAILFVLQSLISIFTCVTIIKVQQKFWLVRLGKDGIYLPNTHLLWAALSAVFCIFNSTNLIWQHLIDLHEATPKHKIVTEGVRWLPLVFSEWIFCHGLVAQSLTRRADNERRLPGSSDATGLRKTSKHRISTPFLCTLLNVSAIVIPILWTAAVLTFLIIADIAVDEAIDATITAMTPLLKAAPTYDPATFSMAQLLPMLAPAKAIIPPAERFSKYIQITWITYSVIICTLTVWFFPFAVHHLLMLHRLMGSTSLFDLCFPWRRQKVLTDTTELRQSPAAMTRPTFTIDQPPLEPKEEPDSSAPPTEPPVRMTRTVSNALGKTPRPTVSLPMSASESRRGHLASQARGLLWSSLVIYLVTAYYCPLAIYASCTTLQDPTFFAFAICYGSGGYAVFGLLAHSIIIARNLSILRARRRQVLVGDTRLNNAFSPRYHAGRRRGRSHLDTITIQRETVAPSHVHGIVIQTRTETHTDCEDGTVDRSFSARREVKTLDEKEDRALDGHLDSPRGDV